MLSDKGSIITAAVSEAAALKIYRKKLKIISLAMLIVGCVGIIAYIVCGTVWETKYGEEPLWIKSLLVFAVPFALGLIGFITIVRLNARAEKEARSGICEFYADCFFYCGNKFSYTNVILKSGNEKYGYIFVSVSAVLIPFGKEELTAAELNAVRALFRIAVPEGEEAATLEKYKEGGGDELSGT